jgi:hypothetical protein
MWYGKISVDQVVKIRELAAPDAILEPKLLAHGYLLGEDGDSSYDPLTQVRSMAPTYDIQETKVVRTYEITEKSLANAQQEKIKFIRRKAQEHILAEYPSWVQDDVALGIYGSDVGDPLKEFISATMTESNRVEDLIDAAETSAEVRAITYEWPGIEEE